MIEWHGWATIKTSALANDDDLVSPRTLEAVSGLVERASGLPNEVVDLRNANGSLHLWVAGCHNHVANVVDLYRQIAEVAAGSYGVLYVLDEERGNGGGNEWQVFVMRRGSVTSEADRHLSPHVGLVEDGP